MMAKSKNRRHTGGEEGNARADVAPAVSKDELEALRQKAGERDEYYTKWLKVHADYENARKRLEKERVENIRFANEQLIAKLFPIVDNFDMALGAMDKSEDKTAVMDGIKLVQKEFHRILEESGVKKIETVGKRFDPNVHEAVSVIETDEYPEDIVVEEVRAGYMLNDRLLRPAQVRVAKPVTKEVKSAGEEAGGV